MIWQEIRLGEFLEVRNDRYKPDSPEIKDLKRVDKIDFSGSLYLSYKTSRTDMILVKNGDLLISGINVYKGAITVYEGKENITATIHYSSYQFSKEKIDIEFLKLFLKSPEFLNAIKEQVPGGIKTEIKPKHILPLKVVIPDLVGQKEIVKAFHQVLGRNKNLTNEITYQLDLIKQLRQSFLREAMKGKLTGNWRRENPDIEPASVLLKRINDEKERLIKEGKLKKEKPLPPIKSEEIPFEIPESWVWCRLGDIALYSEAGKSYKAIETKAIENEYGVIKTSAITSSFFNENENKKLPIQIGKYNKILIRKGDFLICRASGSKGLAGKSCVVLNTPKANLILSDKSIRYIFHTDINVSFIQYFNNSSFAQQYYLQLGTGKSTSMNNITRDQFDNLTIPLPSLQEQQQVVAKLDQLMNICDELERSITKSKEQTEQLLQVALKEAFEPENIK